MRFVRVAAVLSAICIDKIRAVAGESTCLSDGRCILGTSTLNLCNCDLEDNDMDGIAECIADSQSAGTLQVLRICNNFLTYLASDVLQGLPQLERLHLNENNLTEVPSLHFEHLFYLRLDNNYISSLESDAFQGTPKIEQLFLGANDIAVIPEHVLEFPNLFYLDLHDNKLISFPSDVLEETSAPILYLFLTGNPDLICAPTSIRESYIHVDEGIEDCAPPTPAPSTAPTPGPDTCSNLGIDGIDGGNNAGSCCCPTGCGMCGGTGCRKFGLPDYDRHDCCVGKVLESAPDCRTTGTAPCVISYTT